jgi:iron complex transport system substrate-binding protein
MIVSRGGARLRATMAVALCAVGLVMGACSDSRQGSPPAAPNASTGYPVTVGTVTLTARPTRIVVLAPTATEMLFAIGAGDQVVAVDGNSDYPPQAPRTELSGVQPNAEAIVAKNPDLVVISNDLNRVSDQLTKLRVPVYLAGPAKTLDDTYRELGDLGRLTGRTTEAAGVAQRIKDDIDKLVDRLPRPPRPLSYYYELDPTLYSVTSRTFVGSLLARLGLRNVADPADADGAKGGYPQLSAEFLTTANPDLVFLADTRCCGQSPEAVAGRPGWAAISAVRDGHVYPLDDDLASRWGPRVVDLVRGLVDAVGRATAPGTPPTR